MINSIQWDEKVTYREGGEAGGRDFIVLQEANTCCHAAIMQKMHLYMPL